MFCRYFMPKSTVKKTCFLQLKLSLNDYYYCNICIGENSYFMLILATRQRSTRIYEFNWFIRQFLEKIFQSSIKTSGVDVIVEIDQASL